MLLTGKWRGTLDQTFLDVVPMPVLSSEPPTAVVFGGVLQAWQLTGGEQPPALDAAGRAGVGGAGLGEGRRWSSA